MDNILLDKHKEIVKIADFGLSNEYTPNCFLNTHCGSPEYAAPELFVYNKKYGPEIDIWSLGVVFYAMIVGKLPFQTPKRANETHDENRNRLVAELKHGLGAKQLNELIKCNNFFKLIICKMLVPSARDRITVHQLCTLMNAPKLSQRRGNVQQLNADDFPSLDKLDQFRGGDDKTPRHKQMCWNSFAETYRIARDFNIPIDEVQESLAQHPLGSIGGVYNIRRHQHLLAQMLILKMPPVAAATMVKMQTQTTQIKKHVNFKQLPIIASNNGDNDAAKMCLPTAVSCPSPPPTTDAKHGQHPMVTRSRSQQQATLPQLQLQRSALRSSLRNKSRPATIATATSPPTLQSPYAQRRLLRRPVTATDGCNVRLRTPVPGTPRPPQFLNQHNQRVATPQSTAYQRLAGGNRRPVTCIGQYTETTATTKPRAMHMAEPNNPTSCALRTSRSVRTATIAATNSAKQQQQNHHYQLRSTTVDQRPFTTSTASPNREQLYHVLNTVAHFPDGGCGVPMHTAQRAALRKAAKAACTASVEQTLPHKQKSSICKTVKSPATGAANSTTKRTTTTTAGGRLTAHVRRTLGTMSRSFSKFLTSTRNSRPRRLLTTVEQHAIGITSPLPATASKRIGAPKVEPHESSVRAAGNVARKSSGLLFWRRPKTEGHQRPKVTATSRCTMVQDDHHHHDDDPT